MKGELTGKHVLFILIAFFGIIIAVNVDLIIKAQTTFSGEDSRNPYLQGIEYNETLARRAEQKKLGWHADIGTIRGTADTLQINVTLRQKDGAPVNGLHLEGRLRHPSYAKLDVPLKFNDQGGGHYVADLESVAKGFWNIDIHSATGSEPFELDKRIWLR